MPSVFSGSACRAHSNVLLETVNVTASASDFSMVCKILIFGVEIVSLRRSVLLLAHHLSVILFPFLLFPSLHVPSCLSSTVHFVTKYVMSYLCYMGQGNYYNRSSLHQVYNMKAHLCYTGEGKLKIKGTDEQDD